MIKGCIFIGGVHGSGKTTLCERIQKELNCHYISASHLLNWSKKEKKVEDIAENQKQLKVLLEKEMRGNGLYLVDGHFALWNNQYKCENVSSDLFENLSLKCIIVVNTDVNKVYERLLSRMQTDVCIDNIQQLQEFEWMNALDVAGKFKVPILCVNDWELEYKEILGFVGAYYGK